jgi:hypothetical protein
MSAVAAPTRQVQHLLTWAALLGLRPEIKGAYRGAYEIHLNGVGPWAGIGRIEVGVRSGKVLRAVLYFGQADLDARSPGRAEGYQETARLLTAYADYAAGYGVHATRPRVRDTAEQRKMLDWAENSMILKRRREASLAADALLPVPEVGAEVTVQGWEGRYRVEGIEGRRVGVRRTDCQCVSVPCALGHRMRVRVRHVEVVAPAAAGL